MAWLVVLAIVVVISGIAFALRKYKQKWKVIYEEKEMTDELSQKYNYLLDHEVRCKLHEVAAKQPVVGAAAMQAGGLQAIELTVHVDDYDRAMELLGQFPTHQTHSPTSQHFTSI